MGFWSKPLKECPKCNMLIFTDKEKLINSLIDEMNQASFNPRVTQTEWENIVIKVKAKLLAITNNRGDFE